MFGQASVWGWATGLAGLVAALIGLYFASKLNKLTRGGVIGSSVGYVIFGFIVLAVAALFDELVALAAPMLRAELALEPDQLSTAAEMMRLLSLFFFTLYFWRIYNGFKGYTSREKPDAA